MNRIDVNTKEQKGIIDKKLHSQFIEFLGNCIHEGIWVGENSEIPNYKGIRKDVADALKELEIPVLRWPGGCYADKYHWRNGVGPKTQRPITYNENFGTYELEDNQFGTDEFMEFCKLLGAKPWLNLNLLSGSVEEAVSWAEYCNRTDNSTLAQERAKNSNSKPYNVEYWGIGNEAWAGGGTYTPEGYMNDYRKFVSAMPTFTGQLNEWKEPLSQKMIMVGPDGNKSAERKEWTRNLFEQFAKYRQPKLDAIDLHFYNWNIKDENDKVTDFDKDGWYRVIYGAMEIEEVIKEQYELISEGLEKIKGDPEDPWFVPPHCDLYIGEWGNWHREAFMSRPALYQQCTMRDALTTAITLDIFHNNCDVLKLACVAQTVNVLNSLILTQGDKMVLTPNYYVFMMYKVHRDAQKIECNVNSDIAYEKGDIKVNTIYSFASIKDNIVSLNIINTDIEMEHEVTVELDEILNYVEGITLNTKSPTNYNSIDEPDKISPHKAVEPIMDGKKIKLNVLAASVNVYRFVCE